MQRNNTKHKKDAKIRHRNFQSHLQVSPETNVVISNLPTKRRCKDDNPIVVKRIFLEDSKPREFHLCENHRNDPDFDGYVSETEVNLK